MKKQYIIPTARIFTIAPQRPIQASGINMETDNSEGNVVENEEDVWTNKKDYWDGDAAW